MMVPLFYNAHSISKAIPLKLQKVSFADWLRIEFRYNMIIFLLQGLKVRVEVSRSFGTTMRNSNSFSDESVLFMLKSHDDVHEDTGSRELLLDDEQEDRISISASSVIDDDENDNARRYVKFIEDQFYFFNKIREIKGISSRLLAHIFSLEKYKENKLTVFIKQLREFDRITLLAPNSNFIFETIPNSVYDCLQKNIYRYTENVEKHSNSHLMLTLGVFSLVFPERTEVIRFGLFRSIFTLNAPDQLLFTVSVGFGVSV
eukprot:TRINITY_DN10043_c0_g1_i19.p1 TRINITY_DN10043_c0_g1~~TRINITY_DN10043_c0_g1_i19.p1  ORF type:complete len:259 (-),score=44.09 TRINITY_DN10043_c0_g1_i19:1011-1787(-)